MMATDTRSNQCPCRSARRLLSHLTRSAAAAALFGLAGHAAAQAACTTDCSNHPDVPAGTSCLGGLSNASGLVGYYGPGIAPCTAAGTYTVWHATRFDVPPGEVTDITHLCVGTKANSVDGGVFIIDATLNPNEPSPSFPMPGWIWGVVNPPVTNIADTVMISVAPTTAPLQVTGPFWVVVGYNNVSSATQTQGIAPATPTQGTSQTPLLPAKSMMAIGDNCALCNPPSNPPTCQTWVDYNNFPISQYHNRAPEIRPLRFGVAATCPPFSSYSQDCCDFVCATDPTCCGSWHPGCFDLANDHCPTPCVTYIPPSGIYGEMESCGQSTNDTCSTAEPVACDAGAIHGTTFLEIDRSVSPPVVTTDVDWYAVDLTDLDGSGVADFSLDVITEIPLIVEVFAADPNNCQFNPVALLGGFVPVNCGPAGHPIPGSVVFLSGQSVERFYIRVEPAAGPLEGLCGHHYTIHFAPTQCQPGFVCTTATNDCYTLGGPGCNDVACCQDVCACDPFCCNGQWDALCVGSAVGGQGCSAIELCSDCGDPAAGDCCDPAGNGTPGCDDLDCCAEVCLIDSFCCNAADQWDSLCASHAQNNCAICPPSSTCPPATNDCYTVGGPGCNDTNCCETVCACDAFCCNSQWDSLCIGPVGAVLGCSAFELCSDCGDPAAGDCCTPLGNGTPGCNDSDCCEEVCLIDSFCCDALGQWDSLCALHAQNNCALCQVGPTCPPATNDCFVTSSAPGCNDPNCCDDVCANDAFCCNTAWDMICVAQGAVLSPQCTGCGDPGNDCCSAGAGPHCDNAQCCVDVCEIEPSCCEVEWTATCAMIAQGTCTMCHTPGPPNETCINAMSIPYDTTVTMDSTNAQTDGPLEANCGFTGVLDADLWFEFVAPCDHTYIFRLEEADGTGDRLMGLYTTGCGSPPDSAVACDGTFFGLIELSLDLSAGESVLIRVGTPGGFPALSELTVTGYCTGDLNGDGVVDVFDLLIYLSLWNTCPSSCPLILTCPNPVFGLLDLLSQWGDCP